MPTPPPSWMPGSVEISWGLTVERSHSPSIRKCAFTWCGGHWTRKFWSWRLVSHALRRKMYWSSIAIWSKKCPKASRGLLQFLHCVGTFWSKTEETLWDFRLTDADRQKTYTIPRQNLDSPGSTVGFGTDIARAGFSVFGSAARGTFLGAAGFGVSSAVAWV